MNKGVVGAISFVIGAAVGGLATWFGVKTYYEIQFTKSVNGIRDFYTDQYTAKKEELESSIEDQKRFAKEQITIANQVINSTQPVEEKVVKYGDEEFVAYNKITSRYTVEKPPIEELIKHISDEDNEPPFDEDMHPEDEDHHFSMDDIKPVEVPDKDPDPFVISYAQFMVNDGIHHKDTLWYHIGDGILLDEEDNVIDLELIGSENLALLDTVDTIYVRNVECGMDWEVIGTEEPIDEKILDEYLKNNNLTEENG